MGRKAIEKRDNQLIINIDEIEREQQALMLTKSNDLIHAVNMATYNQMQVQQKPKFSVAITTKGSVLDHQHSARPGPRPPVHGQHYLGGGRQPRPAGMRCRSEEHTSNSSH